MSGVIVVTERPSGYCLVWRRPGAPDYAYRRGVASHAEAMRRGMLVASLMGATLEDSTRALAVGESQEALSQSGEGAGKGGAW